LWDFCDDGFLFLHKILPLVFWVFLCVHIRRSAYAHIVTVTRSTHTCFPGRRRPPWREQRTRRSDAGQTRQRAGDGGSGAQKLTKM
jgi:hypothetical protein